MLQDTKTFEAVGNLASWPKNVQGKLTHVVVLGILHPKKGKVCEVLWSGDFPDLGPAMYWAAKKELQAVRKDKWHMATRVLWQHDITVEEAVQTVVKEMEPQMDRAVQQFMRGGVTDIGPGPMRAVDPAEVKGHYIELERNDGPTGPA